MNHPSNVVFRHDKCNTHDTQVVHGGGTGGTFQYWRAALHLVRWQGLDNVYEYANVVSEHFPTLKIEMKRFFAMNINTLLNYTIQEYLIELNRVLNNDDYSPHQIYEFSRAFTYLHQSPLDHLSWHEHTVMPS